MRSLMEPEGLRYSALANIFTPLVLLSRDKSNRGVFPMMEAAPIFPLPSGRLILDRRPPMVFGARGCRPKWSRGRQSTVIEDSHLASVSSSAS